MDIIRNRWSFSVLRNESQLHLNFSNNDFRYEACFAHGACFVLCFLLFSGCSTPSENKWGITEIITPNPSFNGGKLFLDPDSDSSNLELEIERNSAGFRFYINLLYLQASPWKEDPTRTSLTIQFDDQEPWIVYPYLLDGGQRLLLSGDLADVLIQALLDGFSFTIQIGRSQIDVIPTEFAKKYQRLLEIPIADL
jgi:hypothetical protein